ncbi:conjugal transfer protein TraI [Segetibacter koreensis]|uniref:conjugal transfer protein TraI n=1 Tax=Segetibacter koreensis TaxID=398037 RepID=UPI001B7F8987|nr:conjugal transfer protein TraI [Segetibacter koreensis]
MITELKPVQAQDAIAEVIKAGIKKAIKAVDLKIQRLQTKTIWLQNAQKVIENTMAKVHLEEITGWAEKQRTLYADYYSELWKVKSMIAYYDRIREISNKQTRLVEEYKRAIALFKKDGHFSSDEIAYMLNVYKGILRESLQNLDQVFLVIHSFSTQMSDASRLKIIEQAADKIEEVFDDLKVFNKENMMLSFQRAKSQNEVEAMKRMYGIGN